MIWKLFHTCSLCDTKTPYTITHTDNVTIEIATIKCLECGKYEKA